MSKLSFPICSRITLPPRVDDENDCRMQPVEFEFTMATPPKLLIGTATRPKLWPELDDAESKPQPSTIDHLCELRPAVSLPAGRRR